MSLQVLRVLDCTLRDGGYYTKWDFPRSLANRYLATSAAAGVDVVELGLRAFPRHEFLGPYAYTTDEHIATLDIPDSLQIGVMVDAKTLLGYEGGVVPGLARLFSERGASRVSLVRIAAHFAEVDKCELISRELCRLGYKVGLNLMQAGGRPGEELAQKAELVSGWGTVDVLYFADSLGNMDESEVSRVYNALRSRWEGNIGIHAHNNKGMALHNTLAAMKLGTSWLDATMTGMGRGAGNTATELLTMELARRGYNYRSDEMWEMVLDEFLPLQRQHGWGASLFYHFAADHNIHPSYVQTILSDTRYSSAHVRRALQAIAQVPSSSYNPELVGRTLESEEPGDSTEGSWEATDWCKEREVVIIAAGAGLHNHRQTIEQFVRRRKSATLSLNLNREFEPSLISYYVAVDTLRMSLECVDYARLNRPFIIPVTRAPAAMRKNLNAIAHSDYGCRVVSGEFRAEPRGCTIPEPLSAAYALALCIIGGATRIWLAGFDGYAAGDARQEAMVKVFEVVTDNYPGIAITAITPTTYPVDQGSVYAPY